MFATSGILHHSYHRDNNSMNFIKKNENAPIPAPADKVSSNKMDRIRSCFHNNC